MFAYPVRINANAPFFAHSFSLNGTDYIQVSIQVKCYCPLEYENLDDLTLSNIPGEQCPLACSTSRALDPVVRALEMFPQVLRRNNVSPREICEAASHRTCLPRTPQNFQLQSMQSPLLMVEEVHFGNVSFTLYSAI